MDQEQNSDRARAFQEAANVLREHEPALAAELEHGCLHINPNEPFFVVRAQDITSSGAVQHWINMNEGVAPVYKLNAAKAVRDAMQRYAGPRKNAD